MTIIILIALLVLGLIVRFFSYDILKLLFSNRKGYDLEKLQYLNNNIQKAVKIFLAIIIGCIAAEFLFTSKYDKFLIPDANNKSLSFTFDILLGLSIIVAMMLKYSTLHTKRNDSAAKGYNSFNLQTKILFWILIALVISTTIVCILSY